MSIFAHKANYRGVEIINEYSPIDFHLLHPSLPKIEAFAEVKARNGKADAWQKFISLMKYVEIANYVRATGLPCYIIFGYPEDKYRIIHVQVTPISPTPRIEWGGRKDRGDAGDQEALAVFEKDQETELKWRE